MRVGCVSSINLPDPSGPSSRDKRFLGSKTWDSAGSPTTATHQLELSISAVALGKALILRRLASQTPFGSSLLLDGVIKGFCTLTSRNKRTPWESTRLWEAWSSSAVK